MAQRISLMRRKKKSFGVAFIELAIVLPGIFLLALSMIEYGNFLLKRSVVSRAVNAAADFVQTTTPNRKEESADSVRINQDIINVLREASNGLIDQNSSCGATNAQSCTIGTFRIGRSETQNPTNQPYSIFFTVALRYKPITGERSILKDFLHETISESVEIIVPADAPQLPSPNCGIGEVLTYRAASNSFECELVFGGMYRTTPCDAQSLIYNRNSSSCAVTNPVTGSCSCPDEFLAFPIHEVDAPELSCRCNTTRLPDGTFYCNPSTRCRATIVEEREWICPQHASVEGGKGSILFQCVKNTLVR